jgi:uncharacterized protein
MESTLDPVEVRILGSLVEKEMTTPDNYPLTLNALTTACNQASNRDPVLDLDAATVATSLEGLARKSLVRPVHRSDTRAKRYRHLLSESLNLHPAEIAVMGVLMLRGAQTAGEIRTRTARLHEFRDLPHVEVTLESLMTLSTPLVAQLPRQPGQKEARFAHLLSGEPGPDTRATPEDRGDAGEPGPSVAAPPAGRVEALEEAVASLRAEVAELRGMLEEFRQAFE